MTSRRSFLNMLSGSLAGAAAGTANILQPLAMPGILGLTGIAGLSASQLAEAAADPARPIVIAFPSDVPTWDPVARVAPIPISLYRSVFDTAIDIDENGKLVPAVVSAWRWKDTEGKVLELDLRDDVMFHNGDMLTSDDFKFTYFDRLKADKTLQIGGIWWALEGIDTPTPTRAVMHFKAPMVTAPAFLAYLGGYLMPRKYFEKVGRDGFIAKPIGSGPYTLASYQANSHITLKRFDKHWRGQPQIQNVVFQVVVDATSRVSAIQGGQVDVASGLPLRDTLRFNQVSGLQSKVTPTIDTYLIHMVNSGPTADKNVRLAMHHAINKAGLIRAFFNNVPAAMNTPAAPGTPAYNPDFAFAYDQTTARALLAASGYSQAKPVRIKFFSANGAAPSDYDMARAIVQMWKEVGIEAEHTVIEPAQFYSQSAAGTLQGPMLWLWQNGSGDPALSEGSYLNPKLGFSVWRSADVSVHLDPLLLELDPAKRIAGYKAFDQWVVEQGYSLPLMQGIATAAYKKEIAYKPFKSGWVLPDYWKA